MAFIKVSCFIQLVLGYEQCTDCGTVSDVFHTGSPDSPLWEFKHGNGNFKRGDLVGLREIKRRASRHALIHRDSFSAPKVPAGPPAGQPVEPMPDPVESRLNVLEHNLYDMHARMQRSEDTCAYLNQKTLVLMEGMMRCHQVILMFTRLPISSPN